MKEWIPLIQTLVWPVFIAIFLILCRNWVIGILDAIKTRIAGGSEFNIGPSGLSLGNAPKLAESTGKEELMLSKIETNNLESSSSSTFDPIQSLKESFYLIHGAKYFGGVTFR